MTVQIRLFAAARQLAGRDIVELELPPGATVAQLRVALAQRVPQLADLMDHCLLAVDCEYVGDETGIEPGAQFACIPPVSGG